MDHGGSCRRNGRSRLDRRSVLVVTTAALAAAGAAAAAWPFIDQMNPDARERAAADIVDIDLAALHPAAPRVSRWHDFPVFVVRRTAAMLAAMQEPDFVGKLVDPDSRKRQQPAYAKNWHRSIEPAVAVLIGVCTACGCVPSYAGEAAVLTMPGGYLCPCCASHYDPAGRAYAGIAQYNLPVPPYSLVRPSRLRLGDNPAGESFSVQGIERI